MTDLPTVTHTDMVEICGHRLRVYRLNDGRRVVEADDFNALFGDMRRGIVKPTPAEVKQMRSFLRSGQL